MIRRNNLDDKFIYKTQEAHTVRIYVAGNYDRIEKVCSDYVTEVGLCVNVKRTNFIYTYGEQSGAEIQLIAYPKFSPTREESWDKATKLSERLLDECSQKSLTIIDEHKSVYIEREGVE